MAEGVSLSAVTAAFRNASFGKKAVWTTLVLALALAAAYLYWARQPEYRVLFASLSDRDGGAVVDALERLNIPYRLAEPNGAVEVPLDQLHAARYKLAALGLPKGDKREVESSSLGGFGFSAFQEQVGYQRSLEDELSKSVEDLDGVESARVHLALPRQSSFLRERIPPAASVLLKLEPSASLDEGQVESIRHIVANSVPGMMTAQVSVVDQSGVLLAAGVVGLYRGLTADQLEYTRRLEKEYSERVIKVLSPVLAESDYKVQVTAQVDFSEREEISENARKSGRLTQYSRKTTRHIREPRGDIRRLATLVVLDEASNLDRSQLVKLERLARQAIGYDSRRRDSVQVIAVPFNKPVEQVAERAAPPPESLKNLSAPAPAPIKPDNIEMEWPIYAGLALAALAGAVLLIIKRNRRGNRAGETEEPAAPSADEIFGTEIETLRQRVMEDPKVTASVIKLWMQA